MNVWLSILQFAPTTAPRWISTNGPTRVLSPIRHPYRFVKDETVTFSPSSTSSISRNGASFAGLPDTWEVQATSGGSLPSRPREPLRCPEEDALNGWRKDPVKGPYLGSRGWATMSLPRQERTQLFERFTER